MQPKRLLRTIAIAGILSLGLGRVGVKSAQAQIPIPVQVPVFFLNQVCVNTGGGNWTPTSQYVPVSRRLYTAVMQMNPVSLDRPASMVCQIPRLTTLPRLQTLRLAIGQQEDGNRSPVAVSVWLDGSLALSRLIDPGAVELLTLDLGEAQNIALETRCVQPQNCNEAAAWFFQAQLEPAVVPSF